MQFGKLVYFTVVMIVLAGFKWIRFTALPPLAAAILSFFIIWMCLTVADKALKRRQLFERRISLPVSIGIIALGLAVLFLSDYYA